MSKRETAVEGDILLDNDVSRHDAYNYVVDFKDFDTDPNGVECVSSLSIYGKKKVKEFTHLASAT